MILDDLIDKCETIDDFIIENNIYISTGQKTYFSQGL